MKKSIGVTAGVVIVILGLYLVAKEARRSGKVALQSKEATLLKAETDDARASLKTVSKSTLTDLLGKDSNSSGEVSIPVTLKLSKEGKAWKVSGIELAADESPVASQPARPNVLGAAIAPRAVVTAAKSTEPAAKLPENASAYAVYFLANGSSIGTNGSQTLAAVSQQAKDPRVKQVLLRGYSEKELVDANGKSIAGQRADAVVSALKKAGVDAAKIQVEKVGKSPDGDTPRQKRRVEIVLQ